MISERHWMIPRPGFSTEAHGPNGMNVTTALPSRRFRGERFQASIPQPSPISFPPSLETVSVATPSDRRHQRWSHRALVYLRVGDRTAEIKLFPTPPLPCSKM